VVGVVLDMSQRMGGAPRRTTTQTDVAFAMLFAFVCIMKLEVVRHSHQSTGNPLASSL
jgi:hypothetical protein